MPYTYEEIGAMADIVRNVSPDELLRRSGAVKDRFDKAKWRTSRGSVSVTGQKFMNWTQNIGGGGAIDLAMHLQGTDYKSAVVWLYDNFSRHPIQFPVLSQKPFSRKPGPILPCRCDSKWPHVRKYLTNKRRLPGDLIDFLVRSERLYADKRGNAVFLLLGKEKKVVGAELRGTGNPKWRGMAPGSRKDLGFFFIRCETSQTLVICESAIDAVSYFAMNRNCMAISTSGVNSNPTWLPRAIEKGWQIRCGFDSDEAGDLHAAKMTDRFPTVKRLRPLAHDWNDMLRAVVPS